MRGKLRILGLALLEDDLAAVRALVRARLDPRARTLDLACGPGLLADLFAEGDYVGVDPDAKTVDEARRTRPGTFLCEDLTRMELPDGRFDQAIAFDLAHGTSDARLLAVMKEARRVLRPQGRVLLVDRAAAHDRLARIGARVGHVDDRLRLRSGFRARAAVLLTT